MADIDLDAIEARHVAAVMGTGKVGSSAADVPALVALVRVERVVTTKRERLRPEGSPALGATYRDWRDFTDRVARPLVENDGDDDRIEKWHRVLMMEADDYYLAVALVMADNRIRELEAVARVERGES